LYAVVTSVYLDHRSTHVVHALLHSGEAEYLLGVQFEVHCIDASRDSLKALLATLTELAAGSQGPMWGCTANVSLYQHFKPRSFMRKIMKGRWGAEQYRVNQMLNMY
jgi:hypothetical protein